MKLSQRLIKAKKKKDATKVEGHAARPRLDRPMRRAEGGTIVTEDTKKEADRLDSSAKKKFWSGVGAFGAGFGALPVLGTISKGAKGNALKVLGPATAMGAGLAGQAAAAADREKARKLRGEAIDGKEDRKRGGSVKR